MSESLLRISNLGKAYRHYGSEWRRVISWFGIPVPLREEQWVLRHVSFTVAPGEAVGIVGQNGAGKSTLLKLITGTLGQTEGSVEVNGRVAAILELGMGFNPEFTGRQNVFHAAGLMGFSAEQIHQTMPDIEAFAEIGEYFDKPVRIYSSGMQVRVAFSVATAFRPDILIVDEALAVGDIYFQQKCYRRIQEYTEAGTTLLFVTHGMDTILEVCSRAIYLRNGGVVYDGLPKEAIDLYQADLLLRLDRAATKPIVVAPSDRQPYSPPFSESATMEMPLHGKAGSLLTEAVTLGSVKLLTGSGSFVTTLVSEERARLEICYHVHRDMGDPHVGFKIRDRFGAVIFETNTYCMGMKIGDINAGTDLVAMFSFPLDLTPGDYTITIGMANGGYAQGSFEESLSYLHDVLMFTVLPNPSSITWCGVVNIHPKVSWSTRQTIAGVNLLNG